VPSIAKRACEFGTTIGLLFALTAAAARAQSANPPGIAGRVTTVDGSALAGVDVRLDDVNAATRTDAAGKYRFATAPRGVHVLRFRRIGYLPSALTVSVPLLVDSADVVMVASRSVLDTVKIRARIYDVGGIVVDEKNHPIPGAAIDVIGGVSIGSTASDAGGWFDFPSVKTGPLLLKARKAGFVEATYSLDLEDSRGIVLHLESLPADISRSKSISMSGFGTTDEYVWTETKDRLARREARSRIVSRDQLAAFHDQSLGEAIRKLDVGNSIRVALASGNDQVCVLEDGYLRVGLTTLDAFQVDIVDFVELYPPGSESSGSVRRYLENAGCRSTRSRAGPFYAVIWLR
jgi:hypothetical protein